MHRAKHSVDSCKHYLNKCDRAGYSLLEVLVASTLMVLIFACVMRSMRLGNNSVETAQITTLATQYLQDEAERVRALNWNGILNLEENGVFFPGERDHFSESPIARERVSITRRVSDVPDFPDMKQIELEANWISHRGLPSKRTLILRYAKDGIFDYYYATM